MPFRLSLVLRNPTSFDHGRVEAKSLPLEISFNLKMRER